MKRHVRANDFEAVLSLLPMQAQTKSHGSRAVSLPDEADWQLTFNNVRI